MKKQFLLLTIAVVFAMLVSIQISSAETYTSCAPNVSLVSQEPDPAVPGDYLRLVFQISGVDTSVCDGAKFELMPEYPFSLDDNKTTRILDSYIYTPDQTSVWTISYKIRVDQDAINGENELKVRYSGGHDTNWAAYSTKTFNITIEDSRTSFDGVIQETSGSDVSIAIANTGKYTANSMIVKIPEQENFRVSGTNGQMVGNLDSGDYTIVGFTITRNMQKTPGGINPQTNNNLKVQVDYTDGIGERRTSILEIPLETSFSTNSTSSANGNFSNFQRKQNSNIFSKWYFWIIIIILLLLGFGFYNKYKTKIKNSFTNIKDKSKKSSKEESSETPDWLKKEKTKSTK